MFREESYRSGFLGLVNRLTLSVAIVVAFWSTSALAAPRAAVLPFEIHIDLQMDGLSLYGLPPKPKKEELARLELVRDKVIAMLEERGAYEVVDITELRSDIRRAAPFDRCDGCEVEFGKRAGADVTILGVVHKSSEMMINVAMFVRDVPTGELKKSMLVSILQNDDAGWLRAVRNLVENRLAPKSEPK